MMEIKLSNKIINAITKITKKKENTPEPIPVTDVDLDDIMPSKVISKTVNKLKNDIDSGNIMPSEVISKAVKKLKNDLDSRKTVVLDFDGVIHAYRKGWHDGSIYDEPVPGIKETIQELRRRYHVVIVSTRSKDEEGCLEIKRWLNKHEIVVDDICSEKPPAFVYVDDRAICFNGSCKNLVRDIDNFSSYVDRGRKVCKYCNKEFFCTNGNRQYCSDECRIRAQIKRGE